MVVVVSRALSHLRPTMLLPQFLVLTLAVGPALVQAALFPKDSLVKQLDAKGFRKAMKENVRARMLLGGYLEKLTFRSCSKRVSSLSLHPGAGYVLFRDRLSRGALTLDSAALSTSGTRDQQSRTRPVSPHPHVRGRLRQG